MAKLYKYVRFCFLKAEKENVKACSFTNIFMLLSFLLLSKILPVNPELFIARKILSKNKENFSRPIVRLAIVAVALGMAVMICSDVILSGFQKQIRDKVTGFSGHMQILPYSTNKSLENNPVYKNQPFYPSLEKEAGVQHIQVFATKAGIIKTDSDIQGAVFKGIGSDFDWKFFKDRLTEGKIFQIRDTGKSDQILISKILSQKLGLKTGDLVRMFFVINNQPRGRKFMVSGIYETGLEEFDNSYVLGDIAQIQRLNGWGADSVAGFEVLIKDFSRIKEMGDKINRSIPTEVQVQTIQNQYPQIFDWLELQDTNVVIILSLMVMVSAITMISTLLILILESTGMIGLLKALGAQNMLIRRIFLYNATYIIGKGMFGGNVIALTLCWLQLHFGFIHLPQESYYMSVVPVYFNWIHLLLINIGTLIVCFCMLVIPSHIVSRIRPVKAIRWE